MISHERSRVTDARDPDDPVLAALQHMMAVLQDLAHQADALIDKAGAVAAQRQDGGAWDQILFTDEARSLTAALAENAERVAAANSNLRRVQAAVLYRNGLSMERIGSLLGISRQRVAILLRAALD